MDGRIDMDKDIVDIVAALTNKSNDEWMLDEFGSMWTNEQGGHG